MCSSIVLLPFIGSYRVLPSGCHVLWPLCCHLKTTTLLSHHEQQSLLSACTQLLGNWISNYLSPVGYGTLAGFLCFQSNWSVYVWKLFLSCRYPAQIHVFWNWCLFILTMVTSGVTLVLVLLSYTYIIKTILKFPSAQKRDKAFSTCISHITVVSLTYGSCIFMYVKPSARERVTVSKGVA